MQSRTEITRAQWQLWVVAFAIIGSMAAALILLATNTDPFARFDFIPSRTLLGVALAGMVAAFALYAVDRERNLHRLADRLIQEQLESERLAVRLQYQKEQETMQRDFVSMAAHELRSPLTAIKGFTRTLMTKSDRLPPERRTQYLSMVNEQSNRLARLVDDLMQVSRIDSRRVRLDREPLDLSELARALVEQFRTKWLDRRIEVACEGDGETRASADSHKVEEILINLIDNAIKYSPPAAPVGVTVRSSAGEIEVSVRDHGAGIAPQDLPGLFQKFHRLSGPATADVPGTGLGLYIVKGLVEAHGGRVWVDSTPGAGSTFTFTLPAASIGASAAASGDFADASSNGRRVGA